MNQEEWKAIVLTKQFLVQLASVEEICQHLNGLQAQFQSYVDIGFQNRLSSSEFASNIWKEKLVRQWSQRGTVHAYLKSEIPLYLHEGQKCLKWPSQESGLSLKRQEKFQTLVLESLTAESLTRDELKGICRMAGMSQEEEKSLFNPWGGLLRHMVEQGDIYQEYGQKRFHRLTGFRPFSKEVAELEIARRYFAGFGPVSLADARYYFKEKKSTVLSWMAQLDVKSVEVEGETRYYLGDLEANEIPECLFIAGFDQLLLGYEKKCNPFFDSKYLRHIYTLTGIIKPTVFYKGRLVATWKKEKKEISIAFFDDTLTNSDLKKIQHYRKEYEHFIL